MHEMFLSLLCHFLKGKSGKVFFFIKLVIVWFGYSILTLSISFFNKIFWQPLACIQMILELDFSLSFFYFLVILGITQFSLWITSMDFSILVLFSSFLSHATKDGNFFRFGSSPNSMFITRSIHYFGS